MRIRFAYLDGNNYRKIYLPVIPPNFEEKFADKIEYVTTINGLEKSIPKLAGAKSITFQSYFPFNIDDPLATESFNTPDYYVSFFNEAQAKKQPVKMSITGDTILDLFETERWYYPSIQWQYKAKSYDIWYTLSLKEYLPIAYTRTIADSKGRIKQTTRKKDGFSKGDIVTVTGDYLTIIQVAGNSKQGVFNTTQRGDNQNFVGEVCIIKNIEANRENGYTYYVQSTENFNMYGYVQQSSLTHFME